MSSANTVRRYGFRVVGFLALLALAGGVFLVWGRVVQTLMSNDVTGSPIGRPQSVVWSDHVFTNETQLRNYLGASGVSYERWIRLHPDAAAVFGLKAKEDSPKARRSARPAPNPERVAARPVGVASGLESQISARTWSTYITDLFAAFGLVLGASALVPAKVAPPLLRRAYAESERRVLAVAGAVSILCGLAISQLLA